MVVVYLISIVIFFLWGLKMISEKRFFVRRTILDIPILLFLASQIISTIFSIDPHTSFWGYYSRFNGGLLSIIVYIFLYYALVSNFFAEKDRAKEFGKSLLIVSLFSGGIVALWGIPSHFGFDPTCMIFGRGFTTACWTAAFDPTSRIFSTLGQPNWLAAYLAILLPIAMAFFITSSLNLKKLSEKFRNPAVVLFAFLSIIFYIAIVWTYSQSGFIGLWLGLFTFIGAIKLVAYRKSGFSIPKFLKLKSLRIIAFFVILFIFINFLIGNPFPRFQNLTIQRILDSASSKQSVVTEADLQEQGPALEYNITGSGEIRLIVWKGAIDIFKSSPLIGSGVETFAYAYYKHRPVEHNLTSEWDYLYNKAHNEYLNYLATTGILGLGTYLFFIGLFLFIAFRFFWEQKTLTHTLIPAAIVGGFVSIIVSNFFGFSVVLSNLYLFALPAIFLMITGKRSKIISLPQKNSDTNKLKGFNTSQYLFLTVLAAASIYWFWNITNLWSADKEYALGYNFNKIEEYVRANAPLEKAVALRPSEDLYKNELSTNLASLALAFAQNNQMQNASLFAQRAKEMSDEVIRDNPNNVVYYKTRTRTLFTLAQMQPELLKDAYQTILEVQKLAPTDAKILYNKALIEEVMEKPTEALNTLNETIKIKENYLDAHYRKAIVLISLSESDTQNSQKYRDEAKAVLTNIITNLAPEFEQAKELLKTLE
jgi:O-antigen ligase